VGLATFLLGIENEQQLTRHPLRGSLFENLVVAEALKHRFNQGKRSHLHFYRDGKGNEVDLLLVTGATFFPIEIKAGMTITGDYLKGLRHFAKLFPEQIPHGSGLVYGGPEPQQRSGITIVPLAELPNLLEEKTK
jgi:predicted AAA+ superfamily ATPase